jgi:parvulin-like peptidyl-prolyl isomerase
MAKKPKRNTPERTPTKRQLSKWQRQERIRRIVIIGAVVLLVGIGLVVAISEIQYHRANVAAWREVMIEVNGVPFTMEYFVKMLNASTQGMDSMTISQWSHFLANMVAGNIIDAELLRQGAKEKLDIEVDAQEIRAELERRELPDDRVHQDIIRGVLLAERVRAYFAAGLNVTMEQARVQVILVENQEVAAELITKIEAGGNLTALVGTFSRNSTIEGDLGWLPNELMPNALIAHAAFNLTPGEISSPIFDETAIKSLGYWLIQVTDRRDNEIKARAMLLGSEAEAEQVKDKLAAGGNFSALAGNYSQHRSKNEGGELGWLRQRAMNSTAFDQVAFNITLNEISEPVKDEAVQTTGGYWLVMVTERADRALEEQTKEQLTDKRYSEWIEEWREASTIANHLDGERITWAVDRVLERR